MSKSSRAFIISQKGLKGLVNAMHNNVHSWIHELIESKEFQKERLGFLLQTEFERMTGQLLPLKTAEEKEDLLKTDYLGAYYTLLKDTGRESSIPNIEDCSCEEYTKCCV